MNYAFEVTVQDIINIYKQRGTTVSPTIAEAVFDDLEMELIEEAALQGEDLDEQTELAYEEIKRQLFN